MGSESKKTMAQPLRMRKDYGDNEKDKESSMMKKIPIEDYDNYINSQNIHSPNKKVFYSDYDNPIKI